MSVSEFVARGFDTRPLQHRRSFDAREVLAAADAERAALHPNAVGTLLGQVALMGLAVFGIIELAGPFARSARSHIDRTSTPTSGRLRLAGSGLYLSVAGRPVAGSFAGTTLARNPHSPTPHAAMRMLPPSDARHRPIGSAKAAPAMEQAMSEPRTSAPGRTFDLSYRLIFGSFALAVS